MLDSRGFPFDKRIHSKAAKPFKVDGSWKMKRGTSAELIATVEAELVSKLSPRPGDALHPAAATAEGAPAATTTTPAAAAPLATYKQAIVMFTTLTGRGDRGTELAKVLSDNGLSAIYDLAVNLDKVPAVCAALETLQ